MSTDPRKEFGRVVSEAAEADERIVILSADSGKSSGFGDFAQKHPERYYEFGIMEPGVTGIASGLASTGLIPVFCSIAPFVTSRSFEQVRNDLGYMNQNAKIVGRNGGFTYSDLGPTHHSLEDYAIMRMIPGIVVFAPQDPGEIRSCVKTMLEHEGPIYMRIGGPAIPDLFDEQPTVIGKARKVQEGSDVTIVTTGYESAQTVEAVKQLEADGVSVDLIATATPSHPDFEMIFESAAKTGKVATVEEHYVTGGMGGLIAEQLVQHVPAKMRLIGVPHDYMPSSAKYPDLLKFAGIDAEGIVKQVKELLA